MYCSSNRPNLTVLELALLQGSFYSKIFSQFSLCSEGRGGGNYSSASCVSVFCVGIWFAERAVLCDVTNICCRHGMVGIINFISEEDQERIELNVTE